MNTGLDIYTKLKDDHASVSDILQRLLRTDATDIMQRQALFTELKDSLTQHSEAENEVFYAPLLMHSETRDLIRDGQHEHQRIAGLLDALARMEQDEALWVAQLHTLKDVIEHHVCAEEEKIFPPARHIFTAQQAEELGRQFEHARARQTPTMASAAAASYAPAAAGKAPRTSTGVFHEAQRFTADVKEKGRSILHDQQHFFASQLGSVAEALHRTAQQLGEEDQRGVAQYVDQAAAGLERFSHTLRDQNLSALAGQVEDFARRQPAAFIGSAALLGFLAARFLKSSGERQHPSYHPSSPPAGGVVGPHTGAVAVSPTDSAAVGTPGSGRHEITPAYGAPVGDHDNDRGGTTQPYGGN